MVINTLANDLIQRFKDIFTDVPEWAWPSKPSIPLVGENYKPGKGLLIYASAENLSWLNDDPTPQFFTDENAWNRYRVQYENEGRNSKNFFPYVGIQPANDGGLFAAGLLTAIKYGLQQEENPRSFLESIAVTNWNKFSIKSPDKNEDIRNIKKLTASLAFVIAEMMVLQPKVVLIPRTIWRHLKLQTAIRAASPRSKFLPVPQFNRYVVNFHLDEYNNLATELKQRLKETPVSLWMNNIRRINNNNAWRYIAMLNRIITQK
jgi:hypothetical protein